MTAPISVEWGLEMGPERPPLRALPKAEMFQTCSQERL